MRTNHMNALNSIYRELMGRSKEKRSRNVSNIWIYKNTTEVERKRTKNRIFTCVNAKRDQKMENRFAKWHVQQWM